MNILTKNRMIAAALAVVFTAGCISSAEAALSRKPQDNIFYATSTDPLGLDPALVDDNDSGKIIGNIYESLLRFKNRFSAALMSIMKRKSTRPMEKRAWRCRSPA